MGKKYGSFSSDSNSHIKFKSFNFSQAGKNDIVESGIIKNGALSLIAQIAVIKLVGCRGH
jgi:hypothetical protein